MPDHFDDPSHPIKRTGFILNDAQPIQHGHSSRFHPLLDRQILSELANHDKLPITRRQHSGEKQEITDPDHRHIVRHGFWRSWQCEPQFFETLLNGHRVFVILTLLVVTLA